MRRDEWLAGAPILRGRWAAIVWLWWSGYLCGRTNPIGDIAYRHLLDPLDVASNVAGLALLAAGMTFLDQYGRNSWFVWAPDDAAWAGRFTRDDVRRGSCLGKPPLSAR